jgi:hypothetical protein
MLLTVTVMFLGVANGVAMALLFALYWLSRPEPKPRATATRQHYAVSSGEPDSVWHIQQAFKRFESGQ